MLMMLGLVGFVAEPWAADAHDAGFGWLCGGNLGQLMLMMLAVDGFVAETLGS